MHDEDVATPRQFRHRCDTCRSPLVYDPRFDAWACFRCDSWAEETCGQDPDDCALCAARPARPSQARRLIIVGRVA